MPAIHVRAQEPRDVEAMAEIFGCPGVIAGTLQLPYRSVEWRAQWMARDGDSYRLVAEVEGRVVGSLGLHLGASPRQRHMASVGMAVHDDFQGQGVATAMLTAILDLADNWLGLRRVELFVYTDNAPAIHLYEKLGFQIEGTARQYAFRAGAYVDAYAMARVRVK